MKTTMVLHFVFGITTSIVIKIFFMQIQIKSIQTDETSTSLLDLPMELERMVYRRNNDDNDEKQKIDAVVNNTQVMNNTDGKEYQEDETVISDDVIKDPNNLTTETSQPTEPVITGVSNNSWPVDLPSTERSVDTDTSNLGVNLRKNHPTKPCITFGNICAEIVMPYVKNGQVVTEKAYWDSKALKNLKTKFLKLENDNGHIKVSVIEGDEELKSMVPKNLVVPKDKVTKYIENFSKQEPIKTFLNQLRESSNMNAKDIKKISFVSLKEMQNRTVYVGDPPVEIETDDEEDYRELPKDGISSLRRLNNK